MTNGQMDLSNTQQWKMVVVVVWVLWPFETIFQSTSDHDSGRVHQYTMGLRVPPVYDWLTVRPFLEGRQK